MKKLAVVLAYSVAVYFSFKRRPVKVFSKYQHTADFLFMEVYRYIVKKRPLLHIKLNKRVIK